MTRSTGPTATRSRRGRPHPGSHYLHDHVRFLTTPHEGPPSGEDAPDWYDYNDISQLLMYASHYPHWSMDTPQRTIPGLDDEQQRRVYGATAAAVYQVEDTAA